MAAQVLDLHAAQLARACETIDGIHIVRKDGALVLFLLSKSVAAPLVFERCTASLHIKTGVLQRNVAVHLIRRSENVFDIRFLEERRTIYEVFRSNGCQSNIETIGLVAGLFVANIPNAGYEYRISMGS